jgi:hypothetical protein
VKVYLRWSGSYEQIMMEGVYATPELAMAEEQPEGRVWQPKGDEWSLNEAPGTERFWHHPVWIETHEVQSEAKDPA